ncbi:MAG: FtsX-like permease family protein [Chloroflexi bacterium]|nr:FtsX-like permease family protein [Chloroflexota bacterium]
MINPWLILRWSWRDLRARWIQVAAIALVIAIGTGTYAGLTSTSVWREMSNEASFNVTNMYDFRVQLGTGSFVPQGTLIDRLMGSPLAGSVREAEERLIVSTQVSVDTPEQTIIVPGRIVGVDVSGDGPHVNTLFPDLGRTLIAVDAGSDVVMLERNFSKFYKLPPTGELSLSGDRLLTYVGQALTPEFFLVMTEEGGLLAQANFAAVFTSLETAGRLASAPGKVNDLVLTVIDGTNLTAFEDDLQSLFDETGGAATPKFDDPSYRVTTEDVKGDQRFYNILAAAIIGGAVFAAFNLISRVIDSQRREIGISMALGMPSWMIAVRPILFGAQIALLGVAFGLGMGYLVAEVMRGFLIDFMPLPIWLTPFQPRTFASVAALGFAIPFIAIAYPVWRAVRVNPVEAIRTGHLAARGTGIPSFLKGFRMPGRTYAQIPFRNLARAPRRTVVTILGIAAIISVLVMVLGLLDSFLATIDKSDKEILGDQPNRIAIDLDSFYQINSRQVRAVMESPVLESTEAGLRFGGLLTNGDAEVEVFLRFTDFDSPLWRPTAVEGRLDATNPGLVIAEKAAKDLGVSVGDTITLRHPVVGGPALFSMKETRLPVVGIHPHPFRFNAFMDESFASITGVEGFVNVVHGVPAEGVSIDRMKQELFDVAGVGSVQKVSASTDVLREQMDQFMGILRFMEGMILILALLIAYNATSINMDERAREHATMMAFGVPLRTILRMATVESFFIGLLATIAGLAGGYALLYWTLTSALPDVFPELGMDVVISAANLVTASVLGVVAVAAAPLLTVRKLRRMNLPSTLRIME